MEGVLFFWPGVLRKPNKHDFPAQIERLVRGAALLGHAIVWDDGNRARWTVKIQIATVAMLVELNQRAQDGMFGIGISTTCGLPQSF